MNRISDLERHGKTTAIITADGKRLCYNELATRADQFASQLPGKPSLGIILCRNRPQTIIAYLAGLRHDHAALLVDAGMPKDQLEQLIKVYQVQWLADENGGITLYKHNNPTLENQVAVLLSTSGSTGSPKQVVLSAENLNANASSIAEYLGIGPAERAITTLPVQYSYGLSIINSHLLQGATLLMTDDALTTREFWNFFKTESATSLAGVPTIYNMLQRLHIERMELPSLTTLTQAGGRLDVGKVRHFTEISEQNGWRFFVMYGQTEATARMAYMPPELLSDYPDCIGKPIPGGELWLEDSSGNRIEGSNTEGELVYRGVNVMQGYATCRGDLATLSRPQELHTGDLAIRNSAGLYRITGRLKRIIKLHGHRVALDEVEQLLQAAGYDIVCGGDDQRIIIAHRPGENVQALTSYASEIVRIPASLIRCTALAAWPTTESGKIAYHKLVETG